NFGRFVSDFKAFDKSGKELKVDRVDENRWKIAQARDCDKITYWVEDTWDSRVEGGSIFEPGGTNIEAGKNFVINTFGFFGYFEGMKEVPIKLTVEHPAGFYGSTSLIATDDNPNSDVFEVENYHYLADAPMMYCKPDTSIRKVGGADVLVSVYSPNDRVGADAIMKDIAEILSAQKDYLGGELPVEKYAFIIYLTDNVGGSGGMGALEHSYSSLYYMPETGEDEAGAMMRDVAAHEFFHIVTPLNIHSEEIHDFDYIDPKMSRHLWLYEGVTEYSAGHVQVKHELISTVDYLGILRSKIMMSSFFLDTVPFTEISSNCLHEYKGQYMNVYQKGALIGMALDIKLRELSDGKMGMQELMKELAKTYGKDQAFRDPELFDKITELTYPEVRTFFKEYVEGPNPLPFEEIFASVGIKFEPFANRKVLTTGRVGMEWDKEKGRFVVESTKRMNKFGRQLGLEKGDEIVSFDGQELNIRNLAEVVADFQKRHKAGDKIVVMVDRPDDSGNLKRKKLKAKAQLVNLRGRNILTLNPDATEKQIATRRAWLGGPK
ncbi:MAG: peptidase M61, partial [Bacteroidota bacterium]